MIKAYPIFLIGLVLAFSFELTAQTTADDDGLIPYELSLRKDVLTLKPQRAFGTTSSVMLDIEEDNFTAPAPVFVLSREEMERSGVQSLAEAFRLIPGCMVREQTKGNFDISIINASYQIKGQEDFSSLISSNIIILINGIPILQRTGNNIWWESLPSISSIDQIELVAGPSVAIYGISSAGGVVNIVTRKMSLDRLKVVADATLDHAMDKTLSAYMESAITEDLKVNVSLDYRSQHRQTQDYYFMSFDKYLDVETASLYETRLTSEDIDTKLATQTYYLQALLEYNPHSELKASALFERQESQAQMPLYNFSNTNVFLNQRENSNTSGTLFLNYDKVRFTAKMGQGARNYAVGNSWLHYNLGNYQFKLDFPLEYNKLTIRPGAFYNRTAIQTYEPKEQLEFGTPYIDDNFNSYGAYGVFDYKFTTKLRGLFNVSYEHFQQIDRALLAFGLSLGYAVSDNLFTRLTFGNSAQSPNFEKFVINDVFTGVSYNKDASPLNVKNIELGMRAKVGSAFEPELNLFGRRYGSFQDQHIDLNTGQFFYQNNDIQIDVFGTTANFKIKLEKLSLRPFLTLQHTLLTSDSLDATSAVKPYMWGGLSVNYRALYNRLNLDLLLYYNHRYDVDYYYVVHQNKGALSPYFKVTYRFWDENYVYFTAKNFLSAKKVEFPFADYLGPQFLVGLRVNFITK